MFTAQWAYKTAVYAYARDSLPPQSIGKYSPEDQTMPLDHKAQERGVLTKGRDCRNIFNLQGIADLQALNPSNKDRRASDTNIVNDPGVDEFVKFDRQFLNLILT